jgi:hypothetical protein
MRVADRFPLGGGPGPRSSVFVTFSNNTDNGSKLETQAAGAAGRGFAVVAS